MVKTTSTVDKLWIEEVLEMLGNPEVEIQESEDGFTLTYDPNLLTAHQAQEMMAIAERDGRFTDYGVKVDDNIIYFTK